jgi:hypothetical protein
MSVAGILASSLFSNAGSHIAQRANGLASSLSSDLKSGNLTGAQSDFAALQKKLSGSSTTSNTSLSTQMNQLGQDLKTGNISAAQTDFSNIQTTLSHSASSKLHNQTIPVQSADGGSTQGISSNALAALQAYSALQLNAAGSSLSSSLLANTGGFSVTA